MKLATFKSGGQEKIGIVHMGDTLLFDLAAAASRSGRNVSTITASSSVAVAPMDFSATPGAGP